MRPEPTSREILLYMLAKEDMNAWNRFYALATVNSILIATLAFGQGQFDWLIATGGILLCATWFVIAAHGFVYGDFLHKRLTNLGADMHDMFDHIKSEADIDAEIALVAGKYGAVDIQLNAMGRIARWIVKLILVNYRGFRSAKIIFGVFAFIFVFVAMYGYVLLHSLMT
jgi:hypothetical protein